MARRIPDQAARDFVGVFSQSQLIHDLAPELACDEVDAIASMLRGLGAGAPAETWIREHASADTAEDAHYIDRLYHLG